MLQVKDSYDVLQSRLWTVMDRLAAVAEEHRNTLMAGRTHGQHAIPVTFGFKAAAWLDELLRHEERFVESRPRVLVGEFGGAVGTLAALGGRGLEIQKRLTESLGLSSRRREPRGSHRGVRARARDAVNPGEGRMIPGFPLKT
jgi:adenylosuccinate lyase